jgi:AbiV family abortive infection protein
MQSMATMTPPNARLFWQALMDNASALIADADVLIGTGSVGRSRSLGVVAQEELGKALWIYETFSDSWNTGDRAPRNVDQLAADSRSHTKKYLEACLFGAGLAGFWGDYSGYDHHQEGEFWEDSSIRRRFEAEAAAKSANVHKQRGFYVDLNESGTILSPRDVSPDGISEDLQRAAQVVEMLLIRDHSRMKFDAVTDYESAHEQQFRLLPISHPEDFGVA